MKKNYYLVLDVETANSTDDPLVYDLGFAVCDTQGRIYEQQSLVVRDIFFDERDLMQSAYYHKKLPKYFDGIRNGAHKVVTLYTARKIIADTIARYGVKAVCAYNASFDTRALNVTQRYVTKSKYRHFLPYGTTVYCIWHMACQVICTKKAYRKWCEEHGFASPSGNIKTSAECVYSFMTKDADFDEAHTGLADVLIEAEIMARCFREHKKMDRGINRLCWRIPQKRKCKG